MSDDVNKLFDDATGGESLFIPDGSSLKQSKSSSAPNVAGDFLGHLSEASTREVSWTRGDNNYKATVYNFVFIVADENKTNKYKTDRGTYSGKEYVGRTYRSQGIFKMLEPKEGDDFVSDSKSNQSYYLFCESLGVECPEKTIEIDGKEIKAKQLPSLSSEDINGKAVIGVINKGKPYTNNEGKSITPSVVKFTKRWEGGKEKTDDDIPF